MGALASAHQEIAWNEDLAYIMYDSLYEELNGISLTTFNARSNSGEKVAHLYEKVASRLSHAHVAH